MMFGEMAVFMFDPGISSWFYCGCDAFEFNNGVAQLFDPGIGATINISAKTGVGKVLLFMFDPDGSSWHPKGCEVSTSITIENHEFDVELWAGDNWGFGLGEMIFFSCCIGGSERKGEKKQSTWRIFSLKELHSATNNFNYDNKLGEGAFGSVYWGQPWDGSQIAVKRLKVWSSKAEMEFAVEVEMLARVRHKSSLFEEYKFFSKYPERQLKFAAVLFHTPYSELGYVMQELGFERGWGDTTSRYLFLILICVEQMLCFCLSQAHSYGAQIAEVDEFEFGFCIHGNHFCIHGNHFCLLFEEMAFIVFHGCPLLVGSSCWFRWGLILCGIRVCAIFVYILGDKDVFERVEKWIIPMSFKEEFYIPAIVVPIGWFLVSGFVSPQLNIFGLWAYDSATALAMAIEKSGSVNIKGFKKPNISANSTDLATFGTSQNGPNLLQALLSTTFIGLSGEFQFVDGQLQLPPYQIVNVIGSGFKEIGFWTTKFQKFGLDHLPTSVKECNPTALAGLPLLQMVSIDVSKDTEDALKDNDATMNTFVWDPGLVWAFQLVPIGEIEVFQTFVWDPGPVGVSHFTTLRTRWLLRGRICHVPRFKKIRRKAEDALVTVGYELLAVSDVI